MPGFLSNNSNSFNVSNNIIVSGNGSEILAWLSPLDPQKRHKSIQTRRVDNVGDWFLQTHEFTSWFGEVLEGESDNAVLFCCGDEGVGKTFISSRVIDKLCDQAPRNTVVVGFYIGAAAQEEQSPANVMGSLLKQLVIGLEKIPEEIVDAFQEQKMAIGGRAPQFAQISKLFRTITFLRRTIICIDAIDQCSLGDRLKLLSSLRDILQKSPGTRVFLTGGSHLQNEIEKELGGTVTVVPTTTNKCDITSYLSARLDNDPTPDAMNSSLKADIVNIITKPMPNTLRQVSLKIDEILGEATIPLRRKRLTSMTESSSGSSSSNITDPETTQVILPDDSNYSSSFGQCSQHSALDSYNSYSQLSPTGSSGLNLRLTKNGCVPKYPHEIRPTPMPLGISPHQLNTVTRSPALLGYPSDLPTQATGYGTAQTSSYFIPDSYYPWYGTTQDQQPASCPQSQGFFLDPNNSNIDNLVPSPIPPLHQPTPLDKKRVKRVKMTNYLRRRSYTCDICAVNFTRMTDLNRHLRTSSKHTLLSRPRCANLGCKFQESNEVDKVIQEWKTANQPQPLVPQLSKACRPLSWALARL